MDLQEISRRIQLLADVIEAEAYGTEETRYVRSSLEELKSEVDHWVEQDRLDGAA